MVPADIEQQMILWSTCFGLPTTPSLPPRCQRCVSVPSHMVPEIPRVSGASGLEFYQQRYQSRQLIINLIIARSNRDATGKTHSNCHSLATNIRQRSLISDQCTCNCCQATPTLAINIGLEYLPQASPADITTVRPTRRTASRRHVIRSMLLHSCDLLWTKTLMRTHKTTHTCV